MFFSPRKLLLGAALLSPFIAAADKCSEGPWRDVQRVGGGGGGAFCETKWDEGTVIDGLEVFADDGAVRGIRFFFSDGTDKMIGEEGAEKQGKIQWDPAQEIVKQLRLWGNGNGKYLGRISITTTLLGREDEVKQSLDVGKNTNGQDTFEPKVASGVILGAFGSFGEKIDNLGFLFLKSKVKSMGLEDVTFPDDTAEELNNQMSGLEKQIVHTGEHFNNHPTSNTTFTYTATIGKKIGKKFVTTNTHSFGYQYQLEVSGKILDFGFSASHTLKYDYSNAKSHEESTEDTIDLTFSTATMVRPMTKAYCRAMAMSGTYTGNFQSKLKIKLEDGDEFSFDRKGTMENTNWSQATSECQDTPFTDTQERRSIRRSLAGRITY